MNNLSGKQGLPLTMKFLCVWLSENFLEEGIFRLQQAIPQNT